MIETKITLTIKHTRPLPDLCDLVAGRAYTLQHVEDVTAEVVEQDGAVPDDVGQLEYRGNSVSYIHQKMTAYRGAVDAAWQAMRDAGHPPDGRTPLAQAITKVLAPQQAEAVPEGYRIVPDWKGYALLGSGRYLINHAANYDPELGAELIITLATEKDREGGRKIGESRPNAEDSPPVQPDEMVIRIGFLNGDALFALEDQLDDVRKVLEAAGKAAPQQVEASARVGMWTAMRPGIDSKEPT